MNDHICEFINFHEGVMAEDAIVTLKCNYLTCDNTKDFKISILDLKEVEHENN